MSEGGGLVCESVGKADLLSEHFNSKQSREAVDLPLTCHPSPSLTKDDYLHRTTIWNVREKNFAKVQFS